MSRNVTFNENKEPRELEIIDVPGLWVEGEKDLDNNEPPQQTQHIPQQNTILDVSTSNTQTMEPRQLRRTAFKDYSKIDNPDSRRPTTRQAPTQSLDNATEASGLAEENHVKTVFLNKGTEEDLPRNFDEAISGIEADQWKQAMDKEMENLKVIVRGLIISPILWYA